MAAAALSLPQSCCPLLLFFFVSSLFLHCEVAAATDYLYVNYFRCSDTNVSSVNANFSRNLGTALLNLTTLSSHGTKYATTAAGSGAGMVYAMFQCRGDQSLEPCRECMQNATARLPQRDCPDKIGARIQLDGCYLGYDNIPFFVLDTGIVATLCNIQKLSDPVAQQTFTDLVANVKNLAPKQGGFAAARSENGEYAAAQCLGYLSNIECSECLTVSDSYDSFQCNSTIGKQIHLASCYLRYELYNFLASLPPSLPAAPASAPPPPVVASASGGRTVQPPLQGPKQHAAPIIAALGVLVGIGLCVLLIWRYKGVKRVFKKPDTWPQLLQSKAQLFSFQELKKATGNFNPANKLGAGGFGVVYKGKLAGGEEIAVKRLFVGKQQEDGKEEFLNEVTLITSVQHKNLIRLLGCCVEGCERILVYDYLPNKSLDLSLFGDNISLDWSTRYGIILGMAKGLAYLHEESHIRIIHRDIKPGNVLLDDQLNPVIADFGVAKLVEGNATDVKTRVAGTVGYVAPEYAFYGEFSKKVDVYSFGLVSLEVFTGKKNQHCSLLISVWESYLDGRALELVDERLGNAFSPEEAMRVVHVALLCTQEVPRQRPDMSMVARWLSGTSTILTVPTRPTFLRYSDSMAFVGDIDHTLPSASSSSLLSHSDGRVSQLSRTHQSFSEIGPR